MTPDDYTTAARAEAETRWPSYPTVGFSGADDRQAAFREGAEWARVYLSQQEPTDAEVEAAARVLAGLDITIAGWPADEEQAVRDARWDRLVLDEERAPYLTRARAALRAARDVMGQA